MVELGHHRSISLPRNPIGLFQPMGWIWLLADYRSFGLELKKELKTAGLDIG